MSRLNEAGESNLELIKNIVKEVNPKSIELLEPIGIGTSGTVYKSIFNGKFVAVKKNKGDKEYQREKAGLMQIDHPNIVTLFGYCDPELYLIMELCECTLHHVLHNMKEIELGWGQVIQWSKECAETVNYLHSFLPRPLLHRDLKPLNVLLVNHGRSIRLSDFGTMRPEADEMTNAIGTVIYMAPEVITGREYSTKCDVYSWGIMFWEILCRKIPFDNLEDIAIMFQRVMRNISLPTLETCPERIQNFMMRCWDRDPINRPTMSEVVQEMTEMRQLFRGRLRRLY